jgi:hypothetical protein
MTQEEIWHKAVLGSTPLRKQNEGNPMGPTQGGYGLDQGIGQKALRWVVGKMSP